MPDLSEKLLLIVAQAEPKLRRIDAGESAQPVLAGGWSRRQVLGHLIDSASNNHQRFVRATLQPSLEFPSYDQEGCVSVEEPQEADWLLLISLWANYNRYLAHIIAHLPASKMETVCRIGDGKPVPLQLLMSEYVTHLLHHLGQIAAAE